MDRSGLAIESAGFMGKSGAARAVSRTLGSIKITDVRISSEKTNNSIGSDIGKAPGRYITLECEPHAEGLTALLQRAVSQMLPTSGRLFAVGLGNPDITADSLGANVIRGITARRGKRYSLSAIETDVACKTGLETVKLVRAAARELHADCVIAIDALACRDPRCIGKTIQITDSGIVPGGGADVSGMELSRRTLGISVAAVGVPTMTLLSAVTGNKSDKSFHVSAQDCDILIKMWSEIISGAIDLIVT